MNVQLSPGYPVQGTLQEESSTLELAAGSKSPQAHSLPLLKAITGMDNAAQVLPQ